jgi:hypothetical protein
MEKAWKMVSKEGKLTQDNVKEPLKEIRRALLEADVSLPVVRRFMKRVEEKALGQQASGPPPIFPRGNTRGKSTSSSTLMVSCSCTRLLWGSHHRWL